MRNCIQTVFFAGCVISIAPMNIVASDTNGLFVAEKEIMTNSYQEIAGELDALQQLPSIDALIRIGRDIERVPISQKEERRAKLELWLKALDKVDRLIDSKFDPNDVPRKNIAPSFSTTGYDSGVAPSVIKDPKVREQYEQAIKANADKAERYRFQKKLRQIDKQWSLEVSDYMKSQYTSNARDVDEINALIDKFLSSTPRKEQMKNVLLGMTEKSVVPDEKPASAQSTNNPVKQKQPLRGSSQERK